jgi:hypothetical protein
MTKTIRIPCTKAWFEKVKNGEPDLRPTNEYWSKRLDERTYDTITFTLGYPKASDESRHHVIPWRGCIKTQEWFIILTSEKRFTVY